ncbi:hypothetical protein ACPZ19_49540 [Amycolatopsis lurida]
MQEGQPRVEGTGLSRCHLVRGEVFGEQEPGWFGRAFRCGRVVLRLVPTSTRSTAVPATSWCRRSVTTMA